MQKKQYIKTQYIWSEKDSIYLCIDKESRKSIFFRRFINGMVLSRDRVWQQINYSFCPHEFQSYSEFYDGIIVLPARYRPQATNCSISAGWQVSYSKPPFVGDMASFALPWDDAPDESAKNNKHTHTNQRTGQEVEQSFSRLFVLPTAPKAVVDAAYKALILQAHPDKGGTLQEAQQINQAKDVIYSLKGW